MVVNALGACHEDCPFCAREFFKWYKTRMGAMNRSLNGVPSFSEEATKSVGSRVSESQKQV
jgi:hypothetical protein